MRRILFALCLALLVIPGCGGDDNPANSGGRLVVDESFTLNGNEFKDYSFSVDTNVEQNVSLEGEFSASGGNIDVAVMTQEVFQAWVGGGAISSVLYGSGRVSSDRFSLPIEEPGTFYLVFSNAFGETAAKTVNAEFRLFSTVESEL